MTDGQFQRLIEMINRWRSHLTPAPEELRFTWSQLERLQLEVLGAAVPSEAGSEIIVFGVPVTIVERDEDTTFHQE